MQNDQNNYMPYDRQAVYMEHAKAYLDEVRELCMQHGVTSTIAISHTIAAEERGFRHGVALMFTAEDNRLPKSTLIARVCLKDSVDSLGKVLTAARLGFLDTHSDLVLQPYDTREVVQTEIVPRLEKLVDICTEHRLPIVGEVIAYVEELAIDTVSADDLDEAGALKVAITYAATSFSNLSAFKSTEVPPDMAAALVLLRAESGEDTKKALALLEGYTAGLDPRMQLEFTDSEDAE